MSLATGRVRPAIGRGWGTIVGPHLVVYGPAGSCTYLCAKVVKVKTATDARRVRSSGPGFTPTLKTFDSSTDPPISITFAIGCESLMYPTKYRVRRAVAGYASSTLEPLRDVETSLCVGCCIAAPRLTSPSPTPRTDKSMC